MTDARARGPFLIGTSGDAQGCLIEPREIDLAMSSLQARPSHMARTDGGSRVRALSVATGGAAVVAIIGVAIALYFNPLWIGIEQGRTGVALAMGLTPGQVREVTGSILADLFFGPSQFAVTLDGRPVLDAAERAHMVDVRAIVLPATLLLVLALGMLGVLLATRRDRAWFWRALSAGSRSLIAVGIAVTFLFDSAFLVFHLVFFPQGNFSFDPRTQRLPQLFPDQFWIETARAIAVTGLLIAIGVALAARHEAARLRSEP